MSAEILDQIVGYVREQLEKAVAGNPTKDIQTVLFKTGDIAHALGLDLRAARKIFEQHPDMFETPPRSRSWRITAPTLPEWLEMFSKSTGSFTTARPGKLEPDGMHRSGIANKVHLFSSRR